MVPPAFQAVSGDSNPLCLTVSGSAKDDATWRWREGASHDFFGAGGKAFPTPWLGLVAGR